MGSTGVSEQRRPERRITFSVQDRSNGTGKGVEKVGKKGGLLIFLLVIGTLEGEGGTRK